MSAVPAALYKLVPQAGKPSEALGPLQLLSEIERRDVVAFASGDVGRWSRLLAARLGAPLVYGSLGETSGAPGQPTIGALIGDYGLPDLPPARGLFGVVGSPVNHSLSPRLHNGLYRRLGLELLYVPFQVEEFGAFWLEIVENAATASLGLPLLGLSVTTPHKEIALGVAGATSPLAERIGAANTLVSRRGVWEAENTDAEGTVGPLLARGENLAGRRAAVVGVGGAGRAAAVGLEQAGARVCLVNRTTTSGRAVASRLGMSFTSLEDLEAERFDLLVNATPIGRSGEEELPIDVGRLSPEALVVDMVYRRSASTSLVNRARSRGLQVVDGREVLLYQAASQFRMMTGEEMPLEVASELLAVP